MAGPNGAGKTTFFDTLLEPLGIYFVNADRIAKAINPKDPSAVSYRAAQAADEERRLLVEARASFCMETVFSDPRGDKLDFIRQAQAAGYGVCLIYIGVDNAEIAIARIMQRVDDGGHDVPDSKVEQRFKRSLENLKKALEFVDRADLYDNSLRNTPYIHIAEFSRGKLTRSAKTIAPWAKDILEDLKKHPK